MGLFFDDPEEYDRLKKRGALTPEQKEEREKKLRAGDPKWQRWEAKKAVSAENNATRKLAQRAGGFQSRNEDDQQAAFDELVKKHGKRKAKQLIENEAIAGGARPRGLRRLTGW